MANTIEEIPMANTIDEIPIANTIDSEHELNEYEQDEDPNHLITDWFLDSGANAHFCNDGTVFIKYKPICDQHTAKVAGSNQHLPIHGIGTVDITLQSIYGKRLLRVTDVYYSPLIRINVLSLSRFFEKSGIWGEWRNTITLYTNRGTPVGAAEYGSNGLWLLKTMPPSNRPIRVPAGVKPPETNAIITNEDSELYLWRRRLGHLNYASVKKLNTLAEGMNLTSNQLDWKPNGLCEPCELGKSI
jgi:hypothetical protein